MAVRWFFNTNLLHPCRSFRSLTNLVGMLSYLCPLKRKQDPPRIGWAFKSLIVNTVLSFSFPVFTEEFRCHFSFHYFVHSFVLMSGNLFHAHMPYLNVCNSVGAALFTIGQRTLVNTIANYIKFMALGSTLALPWWTCN